MYPVVYDYDSLGRLKTSGRSANPADWVSYSWTKTGRRVTTAFNGRNVATRGYDAAGRWNSVADSFSNQTSFGYDANSRLTTITRPNGITTTATYFATGEQQKLDHKFGATVRATFTYGVDNMGNVTGRKSSSTATFGANDTFGYDNNNRMVRQNVAGTNPPNYTYDPADNATLLAGISNRAQGFGVANQICFQAVAPATGTCAAPPTAATTFGFDPKGNRTTKTVAGATTTYNYDRANRLLGVQGSTITNTYRGADGLRANRDDTNSAGTSSGFQWDIAGGLPMLLSEFRTGSVFQWYEYIYGPGGILVETTSLNFADGQPRYFLHDNLGTPRLITNTTGATAGTRSYDPYGTQTNQTGNWNDTFNNPYATLYWAGEQKDNDTGLTYLRARHYDSTTAQFLQTDPIAGGSCNTHEYTCANPLTYTDPTGETADSLRNRHVPKTKAGVAEAAVCAQYIWWCAPALRDTDEAADFGGWANDLAFASGRSKVSRDAIENAFRHAYWQAILTFDFSCGYAQALGNAHEFDSDDPSPGGYRDHLIDYSNNDTGRGIGRTAKQSGTRNRGETIQRMVVEAYVKDQLLCDNGNGGVASCRRLK